MFWIDLLFLRLMIITIILLGLIKVIKHTLDFTRVFRMLNLLALGLSLMRILILIFFVSHTDLFLILFNLSALEITLAISTSQGRTLLILSSVVLLMM